MRHAVFFTLAGVVLASGLAASSLPVATWEYVLQVELNPWDPALRLRYAARVGDTPAIVKLLSESTDTLRLVNAVDALGRSALSYAAEACDFSTMQELVGHGANAGATDCFRKRPIDYVVAALRRNGCPPEDSTCFWLLWFCSAVTFLRERGESEDAIRLSLENFERDLAEGRRRSRSQAR